MSLPVDKTIQARLLPPRRDSGLRIPGKNVWCASVIAAGGKWHMFSSVWPIREDAERYDPVELLQNYWKLSTIVRAEADSPEGPYAYKELVLEGLGGDHWIHECCHNPCMIQVGDNYVLYFQTKGRDHNDRYIGYATAKNIDGPWLPAVRPLTLGYNVNNPSACLESDGRIRLAFRTPAMKIAVAEAEAYDAPYRVVNPDICPGIALEDPFLYRQGGKYHMVIEDNKGRLTGAVRHGAHLVSDDGINFEIFHPEKKAYTHTVEWQDGGKTTFDRRERPWLILQEGVPTHLVTGVLKDHEAWSLVQPLAGSRAPAAPMSIPMPRGAGRGNPPSSDTGPPRVCVPPTVSLREPWRSRQT